MTRRRTVPLLASTAALAVLLAGCTGGSSPNSAQSGSGGASSPAGASGPASPASPTASASATASASGSPSSVASGGCTTAQLTVALGQTDTAAGNQYTSIVFTNRGGAVCTLTGFPGVAFLNASGRQVGPAAVRESQPVETVQLVVGGSAHALMDFHDAGLYPAPSCQPAPATFLQVYPPNQTQPVRLSMSQQVCTQSMSPPQLTVRPVRSGATATS